MSVTVPKLVAYIATGDKGGVTISKLVAYIAVEPGTESITPTVVTPTNAFSYAQIPRRLTYSAGTDIFGSILLSGDMTDGDDTLLLSGDMQEGTDDEQYNYGA